MIYKTAVTLQNKNVSRQHHTENTNEVNDFLKQLRDGHWSIMSIKSLFLFKKLGIRWCKHWKPQLVRIFGVLYLLVLNSKNWFLVRYACSNSSRLSFMCEYMYIASLRLWSWNTSIIPYLAQTSPTLSVYLKFSNALIDLFWSWNSARKLESVVVPQISRH